MAVGVLLPALLHVSLGDRESRQRRRSNNSLTLSAVLPPVVDAPAKTTCDEIVFELVSASGPLRSGTALHIYTKERSHSEGLRGSTRE